MSATVSIDRTSLSLSPLVISDAGPTYRLTEEGLGKPGITWRFTDMPNSADVHGTEHIAAVREESSLPLEVLVFGASSAAVAASVDDLENALSQFAYTVTVTVDGVARTWTGAPADVGLSGRFVDAYMVAAHFTALTITIPVYPIPGA